MPPLPAPSPVTLTSGSGSASGLAAAPVLLLYAHPYPRSSRLTRKLADAARLVDGVHVDELYENYPDFYIDVARERALLDGASTLVLLFPTQWHSCPALLKEWFDVVLGDAWQHPAGDSANDRESYRANSGARGQRCWLVASSASSAADYTPGGRHQRTLNDYFAPIEQSVRSCGMAWLPPLLLYGAHQQDDDAIEAQLAQFSARLQALATAQPALTMKAADGH